MQLACPTRHVSSNRKLDPSIFHIQCFWLCQSGTLARGLSLGGKEAKFNFIVMEILVQPNISTSLHPFLLPNGTLKDTNVLSVG